MPTGLNRTTYNRLKTLPQGNGLWEGARLSLGKMVKDPNNQAMTEADCILWVDGNYGTVRAMTVVPTSAGMEAAVRTLLQAIEQPMDAGQTPTPIERPKKIVVSDRELQFFLRGVLQNLGITVEYHAELPVIDEISQSLLQWINPEGRQELFWGEFLDQKAQELWTIKPWSNLQDHEIVSIDIQAFEVETLYTSIMGNLGVEFGFLFYRSLDSLRQFRHAVVRQRSQRELEEAFMGQDCFFMNYVSANAQDGPEAELGERGWGDVTVEFGVIHPLEGMRAHLEPEEAIAVWLALEGMVRFFRKHKSLLTSDRFAALSSRFSVTLPESVQSPTANPPSANRFNSSPSASKYSIRVSSHPEIAEELIPEEAQNNKVGDLGVRLVDDTLVPEGTLLKISLMPWDAYNDLRTRRSVIWQLPPKAGSPESSHPSTPAEQGQGIPIILVQSSKLKIQKILEAIQAAKGVERIGFVQSFDLEQNLAIEISVVLLNNQEFQVLDYHELDDPNHVKRRDRWTETAQMLQGRCCLVLAKGATGKARLNPKPEDILAIFEADLLEQRRSE